MRLSRLICQFSSDILCYPRRYFSVSKDNTKALPNFKHTHCYNNLFPWTTLAEFSEYLASTIVYNKGKNILILLTYFLYTFERYFFLPMCVMFPSCQVHT